MTDPILITGGRVLRNGAAAFEDMLVEDGRIIAIEPAGTIDPNRGRACAAADRLLVPGLVNGHTHSHGALGKGLIDDRVALEVFLASGGPTNASRTLADKKLSATLSAVELIRKGCTTCFDMIGEVPVPTADGLIAVGEAYDTVGMRAVVAPMMADRTLYTALPGLLDAMPPDLRAKAEALGAASAETCLAAAREAIARWPFDRARLRPAVAPTIPLHCTDEFMTGCAALAADHDTVLQTHLAETKAQAIFGTTRYGKSLTAHLAALGLLSPRFCAAHGIWLSEADMALIAAHGGSVVHNPMSNLRLGSGVAAARRMLDAGVRLAIGTDATNTSDGQNMFEAQRLAANLSRIADPDPGRWLSVEEVLHAATLGSAEALGFDRVGRLAPGWAADIVFLDLAHINYVPLREPLLQFVLAENGAAVDAVMIDGRMVLEAGRLLTVDETKLRAEAEAARDRLDAANADARSAVTPLADIVGCFCLGHARRPHELARTLYGQA